MDRSKVINIMVLITALGIVAVTALGLYIATFAERPLSGDPALWGQFGDYIGGVLNPLISLATLLVTWMIAVTVNDIQKQQGAEQRTTQQALLLTEFKYMKLRELSDELRGILTADVPLIDAATGKFSKVLFGRTFDLINNIEDLDAYLFHIDPSIKERLDLAMNQLMSLYTGGATLETKKQMLSLLDPGLKRIIDELYKSVLKF